MANKPIDPDSSANQPHGDDDQEPVPSLRSVQILSQSKAESPLQRDHLDEAMNNSQLENLARQHAKTRVVARHPTRKLSLLDYLGEQGALLRDATAHFRALS